MNPENYDDHTSIPMPITRTILNTAQQFAAQQPTPQKQEQVYHNTLAVAVVNDYLQMMEIPTDLTASDSWNPALQLYTDVADLKLPQLGYLECRPVQSGSFYTIPPDVPDDRIGVVVVAIAPQQHEATLLGFATPIQVGHLPIQGLQPIDNLLEHLDRLEHPPSEVNLSQWLQNVFTTGWQAVDEILSANTPLMAFRKHAVMRGKLLDLGLQPPYQQVALVVTLTPTTSVEVQIKIEVRPMQQQIYLPQNLAVKVLNAERTALMEAQTTATNAYINLEFSALQGEHFSIRLELGNQDVTEQFRVTEYFVV
jgi:hypothetical protein